MKHTLEIIEYHKFKIVLEKFLVLNFKYVGSEEWNDFALKELYSNLIKDNLLKEKIEADIDIEELNEHEEMLADLKRKYKGD